MLLNSPKSDRDAVPSTRTLGLERHVNSVFSQTQMTISSLNAEVETGRKRNKELSEKLQDLTNQKEKLLSRNKKLEQEEKSAKREADELLKVKNEYKLQLKEMKKELTNINDDWENKKKALLHQINELQNTQMAVLEEKQREKVANEQAQLKLNKTLESVDKDIVSTKQDIEKYQKYIDGLKERESVSMNTIYCETSKFKEFLDAQKQNSIA